MNRTQAKEAHRDAVNKALERWKAALRYYEHVSDPKLIDVAVFDIEAARKRYVYLLKHGEDAKI